MPAVYAHDRFGAEVSERMTGELKEIIRKYEAQYRIGLQGPDIFFFYGYHTENKVVRFGEHLHHTSAAPFFRHAVKTVRKIGRDSGAYAYLLGYLCHFVLDSECHPYVEQMIGETGVMHLEIEEEFEKLLLRLEGENPFTYPLADLIPTDGETAAAIQLFYSVRTTLGGGENAAPAGWRGQVFTRSFYLGKKILAEADLTKADGHQYMNLRTIQKSLRDMKKIKKFFTVPGCGKRLLINTVMRILGIYAPMNGLMHQKKDNPKCIETNAGLKQRYDQAVGLALELMIRLDDSIRNHTPLPERFDRTFV